MPPGPRIPPQRRAPAGPSIGAHVKTIGVRRKTWGEAGRHITVQTNHFEVKVPREIIHHYDIVIGKDDKPLPAKLNFDIIDELQKSASNIFTPKAVYDGRKNMFTIKALKLSGVDAKGQPFEQFTVIMPDAGAQPQPGKPTKRSYVVKVTKVAQINPEVLHQFLAGKQTYDSAVTTAITAMNVVIRMLPMAKYPFNVRSFFTDRETKEIGGALVLWRGYFQSIRPGGTKMWINIDISTGAMYKDLPLIPFCMQHLNYQDEAQLTIRGGWSERERQKLQRFISGVRIITKTSNNPRPIKRITLEPAGGLFFQTREGAKSSVQAYFENTYRNRLQYPNHPCVEVGSGALIPIELCRVIPGQLMRKQVPPEKTRDVLSFSTLKPGDRLNSIRNGISVFQYKDSEYLRAFQMEVNTSQPLVVPARILQPPTLTYGTGSRQQNIRPENGAWNMREKYFYRPAQFKEGWILAIFERPNRFDVRTAENVIRSLRKAAVEVGLKGFDSDPWICTAQDPRKSPIDFLQEQGSKFSQARKGFPVVVICILPEGAASLYTHIKHFGDCRVGVATQCMKANKCGRGSPQYYANICLKLNVKLGGVNCVPDPRDVPAFYDRVNTMVLGADVIHPAPGATGRPSFCSLVGTLDFEQAKYVARLSVQSSREEMIQDLEPMTSQLIDLWKQYRIKVENITTPPKRVIFYRDGVSEGQFQQVLDIEIPSIKNAFRALHLTDANMPKFTVIVVGKRHHVRFFPMKGADREQSDQSGNCKAGTVVDRDITHPQELDFYLQSHGGLLGTSRPAHYNVLLDENNMSTDAIQQMSFALCHVYARSTRSVSIPAPVYYADIVCSRARNHFDPRTNFEFESTLSPEGSRGPSLADFQNAFKPVKIPHGHTMYFS